MIHRDEALNALQDRLTDLVREPVQVNVTSVGGKPTLEVRMQRIAVCVIEPELSRNLDALATAAQDAQYQLERYLYESKYNAAEKRREPTTVQERMAAKEKKK